MKYISPLISDARNKLGGTVFSRNRSGVYTRARVSPSQPRTDDQQANRATFGTLSQAWRSLTQAQIAGWNALAATQLLTDSLGHNFAPSGIQLFMSNNRNLASIGFPAISNPPGDKPSFTSNAGWTADFANIGGVPSQFHLVVPAAILAAPWTTIVYMTAPLSTGITFVAPYRYRYMPFPYAIFGANLEPGPQYRAKFGVPPTGSLIGTKILQIDRQTGYAATPITLLSPVTGT